MSCCISKKVLCMRLRTAGVVIGWVNGVTSMIQFMICVGILINFDRIFESFNYVTNDHVFAVAVSTGFSVTVSVLLAVYLLDYIASMLLIVGTKKNCHMMLLPWLIHSAFLLGLKVFINIILFLGDIYVYTTRYGLREFVAVSILLGVCWWAWSAIYSLFREIRESADTRKTDVANLSNYKLFQNLENNYVKQ